MQYLGTRICPNVVKLDKTGYIMEFVDPLIPDPNTIREIESALETYVWNRLPLKMHNPDWFAHLTDRLPDATPPAPPLHVRDPSLTHGDCTVSNAGRGHGGALLLLDALPPRAHVPEQPEADMGRILQSAAGWEAVRYGDDYVEYEPPQFWFREHERQAALWWCGVTALRISRFEDAKKEEGSALVKRWCAKTAERCFDAFRI